MMSRTEHIIIMGGIIAIILYYLLKNSPLAY